MPYNSSRGERSSRYKNSGSDGDRNRGGNRRYEKSEGGKYPKSGERSYKKADSGKESKYGQDSNRKDSVYAKEWNKKESRYGKDSERKDSTYGKDWNRKDSTYSKDSKSGKDFSKKDSTYGRDSKYDKNRKPGRDSKSGENRYERPMYGKNNRTEERRYSPVKKNYDNRDTRNNEFIHGADRQESEESLGRIEGRNAVIEALNAGRTINKILVSTDDRHSSLGKIISQAREQGIVVQQLETKKLDELSTTRSHQGVIAFAAVKDYVEIEDILQIAKEKEEAPFIILLDGITDINNFGSILRTANITGAHGVIIPKRRSVTLNSTVAKVAAGAVEYVPVARVSNMVNAIEKLKQNGVWVVGTDMEGDTVFYESELKGAMALVIGSEGEGLSRLVKEVCDFVVKIPMRGEISSLNAGVAAGVVMYEAAKQRGYFNDLSKE